VHLLAAIPNRSYLEVHGFGLDRFLEAPLHIEDGQAIAPELAGHGLSFDWQTLQSLRVQ
jgi:L-alanine-DL-glutamate epimerase-like enolase superfamily enzyme